MERVGSRASCSKSQRVTKCLDHNLFRAPLTTPITTPSLCGLTTEVTCPAHLTCQPGGRARVSPSPWCSLPPPPRLSSCHSRFVVSPRLCFSYLLSHFFACSGLSPYAYVLTYSRLFPRLLHTSHLIPHTFVRVQISGFGQCTRPILCVEKHTLVILRN